MMLIITLFKIIKKISHIHMIANFKILFKGYNMTIQTVTS